MSYESIINAVALAGMAFAAIIHMLPVSGVLGVPQLKSLYGLEVIGADLEILLRHRAVLFGLIALLLLAAMAMPHLRGAALLTAIVSMASFIVIALIVGDYGPSLKRVLLADIIGLVAILPAMLSFFLQTQRPE
ncbi:MAG: hypothetical protein RLZZ303_3601 [Candidatus Hydrogenedentota bacterium]|jgi:hypothetical protein